jgi:hypothetical protein
MSHYGLTLGYQADKCSICGFKKEIRIIYDSEEHKIAKVCDTCVEDQGTNSISDILGKYGKKTTAKHIAILTKEQMEKSGFGLTGEKKKD